MPDTKKLSSFELLLLGLDQPETHTAAKPLHKGELCPNCGEGRLEYNGLLQLACPVCGFVNGEGGSCT